ncbi:DEAD/DEAH box helicase family protein [Clostridioides difficile]|uniref:DEAD/DEAH box helicase n=1 Tax=Clostridioides difficile TaxID=1496 RepID=UPI0014314AAB|nr:DEAD/DEAH box helicase family protein [Clostridioides difficile]NJI67201.1 DEAD/DEAH box helicase family protein [Clostridioides difficile]NMS87926.1 DEAD/DEAH box helicase family protein [Clostridioides difficile]HBG8358175.1 DEAD/DEAH box helicase family protein [Clostridioides difficile]
MEKLKLKRVSEIIGEDYKKWIKGDIILIDGQTGTGKTYFINSVLAKAYPNKKILYICNRTNLKRQIKLELIKKLTHDSENSEKVFEDLKLENKKFQEYHNKKNEDTFKMGKNISVLEQFDLIEIIENITVLSYQTLANEIIKNRFYNSNDSFNDKFNFNSYDYLIFDECHYLYSDATFNNKTNFIFEEIFNKPSEAIKIFMSATPEDLEPHIENIFNTDNQKDTYNLDKIRKNLHDKSYSTNRDYSYLDIRYFKTLDTLVQKIQDDNSSNKWLIFVSRIIDANYLKKNLKKIKTSIIKQGTKSKELESIISQSKFNSKVLIATKVLDNGINIKDENVKNIVIMALDKTTFLQELGRVRVNIDNPYKINLFIPMKNKKTFINLFFRNYLPRINQLKIFNDEFGDEYSSDVIKTFENNSFTSKKPKNFTRIFNIEFKNVYDDLFYLEKMFYDNEIVGFDEEKRENIYSKEKYNFSRWKLNRTGTKKLIIDFEFASFMAEKFDIEGDFAFIKEQLCWLELSHTFNENNLLDGISNLDINFTIEEKISELENFLINNLTIDKKNKNKLEEEKKKKLSQMINELKSINNKNSYKSTTCQVKTVNDFLASNPYKKLHYSIIPHRVCKNLKAKNGESSKSKNYTYWEVVTNPTKQASRCSLEGF